MRRFFPCVFSDSADSCMHRQNLYQLNGNVYVFTEDQYVIESLDTQVPRPTNLPGVEKTIKAY